MSAVFSPEEPLLPDPEVAQLRIPPHSLEAEASVIGGLLLDNSAWDRVGDLLNEQDFYRYEHRQVFASVSALINTSRPADVITVYEHLQSLGKAEEVGGLAYLNSLAQYVPSASNIRRYAEIVRERSVLRKLISASDEIATTAQGIEGMVPYAGRLKLVLTQFCGGLQASMGFCGTRTIDHLRRRGRFVRISPAGMAEGHPHNINITKEAPNYRS